MRRDDAQLRPRKRPRQARAAAIVDAILRATAEAIERRAFAAAHVNEIAERAGVSVGSLYQYYPSKEALLVELIEHHTAASIDLLEGVLARVRGEPLGVAVREVVVAMVGVHRGPLNRALMRELDELGRLEELERSVDESAGRAVLRFLDEARRARRPRSRPRDLPPGSRGRRAHARSDARAARGRRERRARRRAHADGARLPAARLHGPG